ncbi:MAG: hypothetical protein A2741_02985 [Candidatus Zambryskibacteria bacterium RIFCSPHIGHO2_01_FULL_43_27]|uniref:Transcriptional regulator n=1 Tax=Candidatus Zambryskibacteria bacterium RIFCSPLOWO2_01_FULL_43_17 TaxID=1802760 RepID=A0A1G2U7B5_9BACT|nr:MAG: hypothetical protein A2741_02985 [Candidatus Zambryskibacteria bacterium RIFCSPHIGHO2_01_FULL_43_27]OHA99408.1 MAG: hypothetical protein A3E93_00060 [Candidatus Zambryskibacteria bacterium RIFCSPHIGHO2_12_FULL_43_12b]OHB04832.1 MAG: hypothetical protein A2920_00570 [Candidatus Zambryskibacteria bacterium RIFCSPLOWO2_01_FULL_43_17]
METLSKLFGSAAKVKIVKLFIFNPETAFDIDTISERIKESSSKVRAEMGNLEKMRLIKRKVFSKTVKRKRRTGAVSKKVKARGWILNDGFQYLAPLQIFLVGMNHLSPKDILRKLSKAGTIKLVIVAGVFIQNLESRVDLLVVGDHIKRHNVESSIKAIEAELGRELRYAVFETADFMYRLGMYDKLVRDILDYPHEKVVNKLNI